MSPFASPNRCSMEAYIPPTGGGSGALSRGPIYGSSSTAVLPRRMDALCVMHESTTRVYGPSASDASSASCDSLARNCETRAALASASAILDRDLVAVAGGSANLLLAAGGGVAGGVACLCSMVADIHDDLARRMAVLSACGAGAPSRSRVSRPAGPGDAPHTRGLASLAGTRSPAQ